MDLFHHLFRSPPASLGQKNEEAEVPAPVAEPPEDRPAARPPLAGQARPLDPLAPAAQRYSPLPQTTGAALEMVLLLGDVLARVPTDALQPGMHDPDLKLRFSVSDLLPGFSRGRAAISLSLLAERYPTVFRAPETPAHETNVYLPMQKLVQQVRETAAVAKERPATPSPVKTPEPEPSPVSKALPEPTQGATPTEIPTLAAAPHESPLVASPLPAPEMEPLAAPIVPILAVSQEQPAPVPVIPAPIAPESPRPPVAPVAAVPAPQAVSPTPEPTPPPAPSIPSIFPESAPAPSLPQPEAPHPAGIRIMPVPPLIRAPFVSGPAGAAPYVRPEPAAEPAPVTIPPLSFAPPPAEAPAPVEPAAPAPPEPLVATAEPVVVTAEAAPKEAAATEETADAPEEEPMPATAASTADFSEESPFTDEPITVTPAPVPSESTPATVPTLEYYLDQEPLQAIFMTDEALDLLRVSELSARLPGISGCMVLAGESFTQGGERPTGLDAVTLRELSSKLAHTLESIQSKLPAEPTFTLYGGNRALSIFARGEVSLCVVHAPRGFLPGVRERLAAVADILARCLGGDESEELPQEA